MKDQPAVWNIKFAVTLSAIIHAVLIAIDAARHVYNGGSAFDRHTYRYSPLLAWLLTPNEFIVSWFGKVLFSGAGVLSGILIYRLTNRNLVYASLWLFSPLTINISTRGSCDSLLIFFVLMTFYYIQNGHLKTAAFWYGLAVHFRIFPIFFALPIMFHLRNIRKIFVFGFISAGVCFGLVGIFYLRDGYRFLYEAYLYHFVRKDHRHNFSIFYYAIYLASSATGADGDYELIRILTYAGFLPQLLSIAFVGIRFGKPNFMFAIFLQTVIFVAFNKVITAQYFLWYFGLLPVALHAILEHKDKSTAGKIMIKVVIAIIFWGFTEVAWLHASAQLEAHSKDSYMLLLITSAALFFAHIVLCVVFIRGFVCKSKEVVDTHEDAYQSDGSRTPVLVQVPRKSARLRKPTISTD